MLSTYGPGAGGTRTKAFASSIVLRTRRNVLERRRIGGRGADILLESERSESEAAGDADRADTSVQDDVVEEIELWRERYQVVRSLDLRPGA